VLGEQGLPSPSSDLVHPGLVARVSLGAAAFPVANWARYEFIKLLGQGGMGAVYKARDRQLGRIVALKFIRGGDPNLIMRFLQEARAQARLNHPGICKVYEVGEVDGKAYIAMQFIDGVPLGEAAPGLSLLDKVEIVRSTARAVHAAHLLGIIHRDLKPHNVMLERGPAGWHPVIMDFGLAREAGEGKGLTESGAVLGTPAYMSPEQARGDVRILDHRTDVYSLGATLYDLLAGVPPFDAESVVDLLMHVIDRDPVPLRTRVPTIPPALDTIVMKCLAKEREQRYESASALADDLDRFLQGEAIRARRASLYLRGRRLVLRHRALSAVSLGSLLLVLALGMNGLRLRYQAQREAQRAARRAQLERQLAQRLKEIIWLLRVGYALPAHDVRFEQAVVRARMAEMARLAENQPELGRLGEGLVSYALGEGHLALHEFAPARERLLLAQAAGLDSPELHHALGRTLGALFDQGMAEARRAGDKSWQEKRRAELTQEFLVPALRSLDKSRSLELESPEYLQGLIACYRKNYDEAQRLGRRAAALLPWLYEAQALRGHARYEQAVEQKNRGDYDAARASLKEALGFYQLAADIGRSDGSLHDALATAWQLMADLDRTQGRPQDEAMQRSIAAADLLITSEPHRSTGYTRKARAYLFLAWPRLTRGGDPRPMIDQLVAAGERAIRLDPSDAYAYDMLGNGYSCRGTYEAGHGLDPEPAWAQALDKLERAAAIQPSFPWAYNDRALVLRTRGEWLADHGRDPLPDYRQSVQNLERAILLDPAYQGAYTNLIKSYSLISAYQIAGGIDPKPTLDQAYEISERLIALNGRNPNVFVQRALQDVYYSSYLADAGQDPTSVVQRAVANIERARSIQQDNPMHHAYLSLARGALARHQLQAGIDPRAEIEAGLKDTERCLERNAELFACHISRAQLEILLARHERGLGRDPRVPLEAAVAATRAATAIAPDAGEAYIELGRACLLLSSRAATPPLERSRLLAQGQAALERAIQIDAKNARGHAERAWLLADKAEQEPDAARQQALRAEAHAGFERAFALNPLLRRIYAAPAAANAARCAK
jgi:serine/threonine-protein kinase